MDDDQQTSRNHLYRLANLFLSLAMLADAASHRSAKVRFIVLCILRPCAAYARRWLRREVDLLGLELPDLPPLLKGHNPAAARRLAAFFCVLAQVLQAIASMETPPSDLDGWTLYGVLAPVLALLCPIIAAEPPVSRGLGFRALDSP